MNLNKALRSQTTAQRIEGVMRRDHAALDTDRLAIDLDLGEFLAELSIGGNAFFDLENACEDKRGGVADRPGGAVLREYSPDWALVDSAEVL